MKKTIWLILLLLCFPCFATRYASPERHDVFSPNGQFVLDVNPGTETHYLYKSNDRTKPLWSFKKKVWHFPFLVSDDGATIVTVAWQHVSSENISDNGAEFWNKDGMFKIIKIVELCPNPPQTEKLKIIGPIGDFWLTWYYEVINKGDSFTLITTKLDEYRISFADGNIIYKKKAAPLKQNEPSEESTSLPVFHIIFMAVFFITFLILFILTGISVFLRKREKQKSRES